MPYRLCKLSSFSVDSKISKVFYTFLFLTCLARTALYGAASLYYADSYEGRLYQNEGGNSTEIIEGIDSSPKSLVLFLITPEYLVIFAYVILFWQLLSLYYDGHANLFKSVLSGKGKYFIILIGVFLLVS